MARGIRARWRSSCGSTELPSIIGIMVDLAPPTAPSVTRPADEPPRRTDAATWDAFVADARSRARTSSSRRGPQVKAVNGWSARPALAGDGADGRDRRARSSSAGRDRCPGRSPTPRAARSPAAGRRTRDRAAFTEACRSTLREPRRARVARPDRPRDRARRPGRRGRRRAPGAAAAGWRPAPPIQPNATRIIDLAPDEEALWGDLRKKWRQYVNKARSAGVTVVDADGDRLGEFYRDLPRDRRPGRLPDPDRAGLPRRLGGLRAARPRPAAVRPDAGRRAASRRCSSSAAGRASSSRTAG